MHFAFCILHLLDIDVHSVLCVPLDPFLAGFHLFAHELWETTMDPTTRTLRRITLEDARRADEIFTILMGEEVEPRKEWIERNAKYAVNIDI